VGRETIPIFTTSFYVATLQKSFQTLYPHGSKEYFREYLKENLGISEPTTSCRKYPSLKG
jgi:hypothetical protein